MSALKYSPFPIRIAVEHLRVILDKTGLPVNWLNELRKNSILNKQSCATLIGGRTYSVQNCQA